MLSGAKHLYRMATVMLGHDSIFGCAQHDDAFSPDQLTTGN